MSERQKFIPGRGWVCEDDLRKEQSMFFNVLCPTVSITDIGAHTRLLEHYGVRFVREKEHETL